MPLFDFLYGVALRDLDITRNLHELAAPVFLALGRYDFIVAPRNSWDALRTQFQNLTVRVFERSGHSPQYEEASLFDAELLHWISKCGINPANTCTG
jgi:proline iminopeptidase